MFLYDLKCSLSSTSKFCIDSWILQNPENFIGRPRGQQDNVSATEKENKANRDCQNQEISISRTHNEK